MELLIRALFRTGFRRGLLAGNRLWLVLFGLAGTARLIKMLNDRDREVVYSEKLLPGQSIVIANSAEPR